MASIKDILEAAASYSPLSKEEQERRAQETLNNILAKLNEGKKDKDD